MLRLHPMGKIPDCDRCLFYARSNYLVCPVHPDGIEEDSCLDFRLHPDKEEEEALWIPDRATYYNDELILPPKRQLTPEQQIEILDTHPLFTGICPECGYQFDRSSPPPVHWDCQSCGWVDDSV